MLFGFIAKYAQFAAIFRDLWSPDAMAIPGMLKHLTGRLIPLNKIHPLIPQPTQMRPIIALSYRQTIGNAF